MRSVVEGGGGGGEGGRRVKEMEREREENYKRRRRGWKSWGDNDAVESKMSNTTLHFWELSFFTSLLDSFHSLSPLLLSLSPPLPPPPLSSLTTLPQLFSFSPFQSQQTNIYIYIHHESGLEYTSFIHKLVSLSLYIKPLFFHIVFTFD